MNPCPRIPNTSNQLPSPAITALTLFRRYGYAFTSQTAEQLQLRSARVVSLSQFKRLSRQGAFTPKGF